MFKGKSIFSLNFALGVFYLFVFFILLRNSFSYLDPDFGWHFRVGGEIWQTRAVPVIERYDYTLDGKTWVDHEWLMNLLTYSIAHNFGYIVLSIFFALLVIAVLLIQLKFIRKNFLENDQGIILVLLLQFFGLYASSPHLGVRMQEITILCLLLLSIIIFLYNKNKDYRILIWLPLLFVFWASSHGGFLAGLVVLGMFIGVKIFELASAKKSPQNFIDYDKVLSLKQIGIFGIFSSLAGLATLCTPYGLRLYSFLFDYRDKYYQTHISEWLGQYIFPFEYPQMIYLEIVLLFFILLLLAAFILKGEHRRKIDLWDFCLVAAFTFLSFKMRRHFPLLFVVSLPILAKFFINFFKIKFVFGEGVRIKSRLIRVAIIAMYVSTVLIAGVLATFNLTDHPEVFFREDYPYAAVKFLRAHPEWNERKIFNEYGWGGYLIWRYPERKLFIDGRLPQYELNGHSILEEYFSFSNKEKIDIQLKKYEIGLALLKIKQDSIKIHWWEKMIFMIDENSIIKAQKTGLALRDYLAASGEWQSVYNDGLAEIFIKK
jgi:hypothetical protein